MMPKHKHVVRVLFQAQQRGIQDENLTMHVLLFEASLCCAMCVNKATMQSSSMEKITVSCLPQSCQNWLATLNSLNCKTSQFASSDLFIDVLIGVADNGAALKKLQTAL